MDACACERLTQNQTRTRSGATWMNRPVKSLWPVLLAALPVAAQEHTPTTPDSGNGSALFEQNCAVCHDSGQARIPIRAQLQAMPRQQILRALETGVMAAQGSQRT